ncbi:boLa class II histocompatibility antigen, DQB*0101 beta chain [Chanos chanos]|uniref:Beta-2-microglobulin n=1 Tax=Chanos chanos TaxID=29144 RepID=A0A6J2UNX9_CHACN|nr:boLa class II histocompatibility antigen, DQB*0101 beta chain-like [Chanos chanos]
MWTDYQRINVLAYSRMGDNGSVDQDVVVQVNGATFAYFDKVKDTFVLRPHASAGFSVLEDTDQSFCKTEVLKGFFRQTQYLHKLKEETKSAKSPLVSPSVNMYSQFPDAQGKQNYLYCYATGFYPGDIEINFFLNGRPSAKKVMTSDLVYSEDWKYKLFSYIAITPQPGEEYACQVKHSSMLEPKVTTWSESSVFYL